MKRPVTICLVYLILIALAIPWYWPADSSLVILGLPAWVLIAIAVSFVASVFTAVILLMYPWENDTGTDG